MSRFDDVIAAIDRANADDPFTIEIDGVLRPKEQAHAELMTEWVLRLDPGASEQQLIAARAHHLRRWSSPRASFPEGRAGYLRWRSALKKQHAEEVGVLLADAGYDDDDIAHVQRIIRKEGLGRPGHDALQVHEDALCLVFLQTQLASTADRLGDEHMLGVIRKTAAKMSAAGLTHVAGLAMRDEDRDLIARALN